MWSGFHLSDNDPFLFPKLPQFLSVVSATFEQPCMHCGFVTPERSSSNLACDSSPSRVYPVHMIFPCNIERLGKQSTDINGQILMILQIFQTFADKLPPAGHVIWGGFVSSNEHSIKTSKFPRSRIAENWQAGNFPELRRNQSLSLLAKGSNHLSQTVDWMSLQESSFVDMHACLVTHPHTFVLNSIRNVRASVPLYGFFSFVALVP